MMTVEESLELLKKKEQEYRELAEYYRRKANEQGRMLDQA
jgi:hypothetical protein